MMTFKEFLQDDEASEEQEDIAKLLAKIPPKHAALVRNFHWRFTAGNTIDNDQQHVGYMDDNDKEIAIAAPWNYGREFTVLHEIGHKVWENFVQPYPQLIRLWTQIVGKTKNRQDQPPEELFSMAYANHFVKNKIVIHTHPEWEAFVSKVCQI